ncbi:MAG: hypothetical protein V1701_05135 [Planctomycetota bacterium]
MKLKHLYIITIFIGLAFSLVPPLYPDTPSSLSKDEWAQIKSKYMKLYQAGTTADKKAAIKVISDVSDRFTDADDDYAHETMELLLWFLSVEKEEPVLNDIKNCLMKFSKTAYVRWLGKNYQRLVTTEAAKLALIDMLSIMANNRNINSVSAICRDLAQADESSAVRKSARSLLVKILPRLAPDVLAYFAGSADLAVSKAALKILGEICAWEETPNLIGLLDSKVLDKDVRNELVATLAKITGQDLGDKPQDWQKWWATNPQVPDAALKHMADRAIKKGSDNLIERCLAPDMRAMISFSESSELVFYTLVKSGQEIPASVKESFLKELFNKNLKKTYHTALLAMTLCYLDKDKYRDRIIQCAQFLLANQSGAGNWTYGAAVPSTGTTPGSTDKGVTTPGIDPKSGEVSPTNEAGLTAKTKFRIPPRRKDKDFDNSNTQYALLGLHACAEAGLEIPKEAWQDAEKHLLRTQAADGGWCYSASGTSYGSMTVGGLGGLAICKHYLGREVDNNSNIKKAVGWLANNFTVVKNPCTTDSSWDYYYLYGLERVGALVGRDAFGGFKWYPLGALYLISKQQKDGSWMNGNDTCFAILFLCRATKPLKKVITESTDKKDK